jgi:hypothetical protein
MTDGIHVSFYFNIEQKMYEYYAQVVLRNSPIPILGST